MAGKDITLHEVIAAKELCEERICSALADALGAFNAETGVAVRSIDVRFIDTTTCCGDPTYAVRSVNIKLDL